MSVKVTGVEFNPARVGYARLGVEKAVTKALGSIGAQGEFGVVSVSGGNPNQNHHPELLATVGGIINGLSGLKPPRELVDLSYINSGEHVTAFITAQVHPSPVG